MEIIPHIVGVARAEHLVSDYGMARHERCRHRVRLMPFDGAVYRRHSCLY